MQFKQQKHFPMTKFPEILHICIHRIFKVTTKSVTREKYDMDHIQFRFFLLHDLVHTIFVVRTLITAAPDVRLILELVL